MNRSEKNPFAIVGLILACIACVCASAYIDYAWKKAIVRDAIDEAAESQRARHPYRISLEDSLAEHYCGVDDWKDGRVKVNGSVPPQFDVMLCEGDYVEAAMKYPLIKPDGTKQPVVNTWIIVRDQ
jgi:hypothetical protein